MKKILYSLLTAVLTTSLVFAQDAPKKVILKTEPEKLVVETNKTTPINVVAYDEDGNKLEKTQEFYFVAEFRGVDKFMIFNNIFMKNIHLEMDLYHFTQMKHMIGYMILKRKC